MASDPAHQAQHDYLSSLNPADLASRITELEAAVRILKLNNEALMRGKHGASHPRRSRRSHCSSCSSRASSTRDGHTPSTSGRHRCPVNGCQRSFGRQDHLNRHIHGGQDEQHRNLALVLKETHCAHCSRDFHRPCDLVRHEKFYHGESYISRAYKFSSPLPGVETAPPLPSDGSNDIDRRRPVPLQPLSTFQQSTHLEANGVNQGHRSNAFTADRFHGHQFHTRHGNDANNAIEHDHISGTTLHFSPHQRESGFAGDNMGQIYPEIFSAAPHDASVYFGAGGRGLSAREFPGPAHTNPYNQTTFENSSADMQLDIFSAAPYDLDPNSGSVGENAANFGTNPYRSQAPFVRQTQSNIFGTPPHNYHSRPNLGIADGGSGFPGDSPYNLHVESGFGHQT